MTVRVRLSNPRIIDKLPIDTTVCLSNKQAIFQIRSIFSIFLPSAGVSHLFGGAVMSIHVVKNFQWPPEPNENTVCCICPVITGHY